MKKVVATAVLLMSSEAMAVNAYVGAQYSGFFYKESGFEVATPSGLTLRGGVDLNEYFAIEGRVGTGLKTGTISETYNGQDFDFNIDIDSFSGIYGVVKANNDVFGLYAMIGRSKVSVTASVLDVSSSDSASSPSFGVGMSVVGGNNASLNLEYMRYLKFEETTISALSLGINITF